MSELKKIPVILDGDPGHDDAIGWTLAQGSGRFNILAVTSCSGNVGIKKRPTIPFASVRCWASTHPSPKAARTR